MLKLSLDDVFPNNSIFIPYIIEKIDTETGKVLRRIDNREIPYRRFTTVCDTLRLGITGSDGILIKFDGSYTGMFAQIRLIILSSFVITLLVAVILFGILRIILSQQKLSEFRESFVGHMIHEIRNPITYLKRVLELSPQIGPQAQVAAAYRKINDLNMVIEKLLSTTSNRLHIQKQSVDAAQLLEAVCATYPEVSITTEIAPGITTLRADPFHYHNALRNLVDNAIKYSPGEKRISVRCYLENDRICMAVRDHGIGIPVSFQFMVFDRYFQVPRRKSVDVSGFGLGLSYVRQVAAAHGGEVHLTSVYHQGSIFTLEIPYDPE